MSDEKNNFPLFLAKKYGITYEENSKSSFFSLLALKGQDFLARDDIEEAKKISGYLFKLTQIWRDKQFLLKYYLFISQLLQYQNKDPLGYLLKAAKIAKKQKMIDFELGLLTQIALEQYRQRKHSKALRTVNRIEKIVANFDITIPTIMEIKAKIYWELDKFKEGVEATFEWLKELCKECKDISSLFMAIVYLLTIIKSLPERFTESQKNEIRGEIVRILNELSKMHYLYDESLHYISFLFSKPIALIEPEIIDDFTEALIMNARWTVPDQFLFICSKLLETLVEIDRKEKALEVINHALQFSKDMKYDKIEEELSFKRVEILSKLFYFENFNSVSNIFDIEKIILQSKEEKEKKFVRKISLAKNRFPCISYSSILELLNKTDSTIEIEERELKILPQNSYLGENYFIISLHLDKLNLSLLVKEEFQAEFKDLSRMSSCLLPYYRIIGLLDENRKELIKTIDEIEELLSSIQKGIICPTSKVKIIIPKNQKLFPVFQYFEKERGFSQIKLQFKLTASKLKSKYDFLKDSKFIRFFESDPLTIFDLSLRNQNQLTPFSRLCYSYLLLDTTEEELYSFFQEFISNLLNSPGFEEYKDYFYLYAFLYRKYELANITPEESQKQRIEKTLSSIHEFAIKTKVEENVIEAKFLEIIYTFYISGSFSKEQLKAFSKFNLDKFPSYQVISHFFNSLEEKPIDALTRIFELVNHIEWEKIDHLISIFASKDRNTKIMLNELKDEKLEIHTVDNIIILAKLVEKMQNSISETDFSLVYEFLITLKKKLAEFKEKSKNKHKWLLSIILVKRLLYKIGEKLDRSEESLLIDSIEYCDWIDDINCLVLLLIKKINLLLKKGDYAKAKKFYNYLHQQLLWNWDYTQCSSNENQMRKIKEIETKIQNQYLI
ncbi:MAG: hypothetical protein K9W45_04995 [Candidatus Heimdallarchaeum aukensis]|uniref:Uncharacterized protein n=1 Tax=Candidatus Heimdallarchaeum aukensis TaxID=2876573 RepID=A0A9Y1BMX6_9ARCH|nr:MAG: hypothetical protein K9W45_04995 [Candidatus Heimdallarchaeum aukensis]